jgi:hypothetical protein
MDVEGDGLGLPADIDTMTAE